MKKNMKPSSDNTKVENEVKEYQETDETTELSDDYLEQVQGGAAPILGPKRQ